MTDVFIVIGHEITFPAHRLSNSSSLRCDLLWSYIRSRTDSEYTVIFMGKGRLQGDCELTISECMYLYYKEKYGELASVYIDQMSKDSVGDAIYSMQALEQIQDASNVVVITSDWHIKRLSVIFERVYGSLYSTVSIIGTNEVLYFTEEKRADVNKSEAESLNAFLSTFPNKDDNSDWCSRLRSHHPLYLER